MYLLVTLLGHTSNSNPTVQVLINGEIKYDGTNLYSNENLMDILEFNTLCNYNYALSNIIAPNANGQLISDYFKEKKFKKI